MTSTRWCWVRHKPGFVPFPHEHHLRHGLRTGKQDGSDFGRTIDPDGCVGLPVGAAFDPEYMVERFRAGVPEYEILQKDLYL